MSVEGVASAAGVGKQTIYRWWSSKSALVADCLLEGLLLPGSLVPENTGDVRADLASWLDEILALLEQPGGEALLRSLMAAATENVEVGRRLNDTLGASSLLTARLQSAVDSGDLAPDAPLETIGQLLIGAVLFRVISGATENGTTGAELVRAILRP